MRNSPLSEKQSLSTMILADPFQKLYTVAMDEIDGPPDEKKKIFDLRLQKFFNYGKWKIDSRHEFFNLPFEPNYSCPQAFPCTKGILIYGVDFLSKKQVKNMFACHGKITRLGESHIQIQFRDIHTYRDSLRDWSQTFQLKEEDENAEFPPRGWFNLKPYKVKGFERKLKGRFLTNFELENGVKVEKDIMRISKQIFNSKKKEEENEESIHSIILNKPKEVIVKNLNGEQEESAMSLQMNSYFMEKDDDFNEDVSMAEEKPKFKSTFSYLNYLEEEEEAKKYKVDIVELD